MLSLISLRVQKPCPGNYKEVGMRKWLVTLVVLAIGSGAFAGDASDAKKGDSKEASVVKLTTDNFDKTLKDNAVVLVDFWAPWCGPCRVQAPILEEVATQIDSDTVIGKVNVDENKELASRYEISSIPTLIVFKDGVIQQKLVGVHQKDDLLKMINEAK